MPKYVKLILACIVCIGAIIAAVMLYQRLF